MTDDLGPIAQARRYYVHVKNGGKLRPDDVIRMVQHMETQSAQISALHHRLNAVVGDNIDLRSENSTMLAALGNISDIEPDPDNMGRFHDIANTALAKLEAKS